MEKRENLSSRLGFILLSAGCAIGLGNVWKFPYMVGQNGGAAFVLIYFLCLIVMGIPMMTVEFAIGRASQKSPMIDCKVLQKQGQKWHLHGPMALVGNYILMMFYTTVAGWMLNYFLKTATGEFSGKTPTQIDKVFSDMTANPWEMLLWMSVVVVLGFLICSLGLQNGVEKITKVMMIGLIVLILALAVNSMLLEGGQEGLVFYLKPDFTKVTISTVVAAMNQAFFTLSIGIGAMAIFGSYIGKEHSLMGESVRVAILDTFVAVCAGLIIFPACSAFDKGGYTDAGPPLIFQTLPNIFSNMSGGRFWGSIFFVFMAFAALSTVIAVFECIIACTIDAFGWSRKKACVINGIATFALSVPCVLGFNVIPTLMGNTVLDIEDIIVSNFLLPLGALIYLLFCVSKKGWGWDNFVKEANSGNGLKIPKWLKPYMTYILPLIISVIFVLGVFDVLKKFGIELF